MASKSEKVKTLPVHSFRFGENTVLLTGLPPRTRTNNYRRISIGSHGSEAVSETRQIERNFYEVRVNGVHVGAIHRPFGAGRQPYILERLGFSDHASEGIAYGRGYPYRDTPLFELQEIAEKAAAFRIEIDRQTKFPILHTVEEFEEYRAIKREADRLETEERARRSKALDEEIAAQKATEKQLRLDTVEGLKSISDRLGTTLTNFEMNALKRAVEHFNINPNAYWEDHANNDG
jgi:hypothetical protein